MVTTNGISRDYGYTAARLTMVREQLERRDITDSRVLQAMREVPRHLFVAPEWRPDAYSDRPLPIGEGQTISQPYMVALMLQSLRLCPEARVLEVGTGSGYQAAVLSCLVAQVYSIEYFPGLAHRARRLLSELGYTNVHIIVGDGGEGVAQYAPYDGIVVAAGAPEIPRPLRQQLADGGRLVIPVGEVHDQELLVIMRHGSDYSKERSVPCRFVPLLGKAGWEKPK